MILVLSLLYLKDTNLDYSIDMHIAHQQLLKTGQEVVDSKKIKTFCYVNSVSGYMLWT